MPSNALIFLKLPFKIKHVKKNTQKQERKVTSMEHISKDTLKDYDKIIIDTSAAMHYWALKKFISDSENLLINASKKIFVPKVVWMELVRAYNSRDKEKVERSENAISLISAHRNIFEIEDERFFQDEMDLCFADQVLLSNLILDKTDSKILFITNDRMLSRDANEINHQASCKGYKIETCYIANSGMLKPGYKDLHNEPIVEKVEVIKYIREPEESKKKSSLLTFGKYTLAVLSGIFIGSYGKDFINNVFKDGGLCHG